MAEIVGGAMTWRDLVVTLDRMDELRFDEYDGADGLAIRRSLAAAAWLVSIAEHEAKTHLQARMVVAWLNHIGQRFAELEASRLQ